MRPRDAAPARTVPGATLERGLRVLRAFRSDRAALSNAELVRRTGLSKATVSRLTSTLLQLGFLRHQVGSRSFELAAGAVELGRAFIDSSDLLQAVQPFMQDLAERLEVSAALAVADDLDMVYLAFRSSRRVATLRLGVGSVLPMATSAIGRAYLWALPPAEQRALMARMRRMAGDRADELEAAIRASFAELDATGTCCVWAGVLRDTYGIALPVRVGRQRVLLALSCGKAVVRPDLASERRRIVPVLNAAALELQDLLSGLDGPA